MKKLGPLLLQYIKDLEPGGDSHMKEAGMLVVSLISDFNLS